MIAWRSLGVLVLLLTFSGLPAALAQASVVEVVLPQDPSPSQRRAADELKRFVGEVTGATVTVHSDAEARPQAAPNVSRRFLLGNTRQALAAGLAFDAPKLGDEGFAVSVRGNDVFVLGSSVRGVMYGVYSILEDDFGCRWYTSTVSRIPRRDLDKVQVRDRTEVPAFEYRDPWFWDALERDYAARNRTNGSTTYLDESTGGKHEYWRRENGGFVHTFYELVPPARYGSSNPEYFSLIEGTRRTQLAQICLTNADVLRIATAKIRSLIKEHPKAILFSVSPEDHLGYCECTSCSDVVKDEQSQMGPVLRFVNAIAAAVEKDHPEKLIHTLAYTYYEKPPAKERPRKNVRIQWAPIDMDFAHPIGTSGANQREWQNLQAWTSITDKLYVWDYVVNFQNFLQPWPNLDGMIGNLKIYQEKKIKGVFAQARGYGELNELRAWLLAKLLWNPQQDASLLIDDFLAGYYGEAGPVIRRYIELVHAPVRDPKNPAFATIWDTAQAAYLTDRLLDDADRLFDEAEAAVRGAPEVAARVRDLRLSAQWTRLMRNGWAVHEGRWGFGVTPKMQALAGEVLPAVLNRAMPMIAEGLPPKSYIDELRFGQSWPVMTLENKRIRVEVVPELNGRVVQLVDKSVGENLLYPPGRGLGPLSGGIEEFMSNDYRPEGWDSPLTVVSSSASRLELRGTLAANRVEVRRTIELASDGVTVLFSSSYRNLSTSPLKLAPRVQIQMFAPRETAVEMVKRDGSQAKVVPMGLNTHHWYRDADAPRRIELKSRLGRSMAAFSFDNEQMGAVYLFRVDNQQFMTVEPMVLPKAVTAGGRATVEWKIALPH